MSRNRDLWQESELSGHSEAEEETSGKDPEEPKLA